MWGRLRAPTSGVATRQSGRKAPPTLPSSPGAVIGFATACHPAYTAFNSPYAYRRHRAHRPRPRLPAGTDAGHVVGEFLANDRDRVLRRRVFSRATLVLAALRGTVPDR